MAVLSERYLLKSFLILLGLATVTILGLYARMHKEEKWAQGIHLEKTKLNRVSTTGDISQLTQLRRAVQRQLDRLQNPSNCSTTRKLLCKIEHGCGIGCKLHHISTCFLLATGTNRTLIVSMGLGRFRSAKITDAYLPLTETCQWSETEYKEAATIKGDGVSETTSEKRVVKKRITGWVKAISDFAPNTYPESLKNKLEPNCDDPHIWWIGQLDLYITRMQPNFVEELNKIQNQLGFIHPIVGIHVRRTDKLLEEAGRHEIEEYMVHVARWFEERKITERRVFIATDDPSVHEEARNKYPSYSFITNDNNSVNAQMDHRKYDEGFWGIVKDIALLGKCDFVVCTFSSNIGRLTHETLLAKSNEKHTTAKSVDFGWFFYGQVGIDNHAIEDHNSTEPGQLQFRTGDIITGAKCKETCTGKNKRTGRTGRYPETKVKKVARPVSYVGMKNV